MSESAVPLILDTDIGDDVDDVFALLLAALEPRLNLRCVTTVYGDVAQRARIARKLLLLAGRGDVPVAAGHGLTLGGRDPGAMIASGQGFVAAPGSEEWESLGAGLHPEPAVDVLIESIRAAPEPPVLAAVGPLTNLGDALRRAPDLARRVRSVVLMGGQLGPDAASGEHNFNSDPQATQIVLESGAPLKIGTYEITRQARLSQDHLPRLRAGSPATRAAAEQLALYLGQRNRSATSMYDPLSLTVAYTDAYLTLSPVSLRVTTQERRAVLHTEAGGTPNAEVSTALDAPAFVEHLLTAIGA
jgi:inosine-uridine nucleoside N-ribohydrolase